MFLSQLLFWHNPEFLRHRRSELRRGRAITVLAVVLVICVLVWLGCWGSEQQRLAVYHSRGNFQLSPEKIAQLDAEAPVDFWRNYYQFLIGAQLAVLSFWSLLCCAQSISGERERKTWDFQRSTTLTPAEFLIGKLLGEPIVAWFIVLCCIPVTAIAGWRGHLGISNILSAYALIFSSALFIGLIGLWLSNLFETRSRGVGLIGTFAIYIFLIAVGSGAAESSFPGFAGFSPLPGLAAQLGNTLPRHPATIFGAHVSWLTMSLALYVTFGAWFVLMVVRSLKKDFDQIKTLSRWQAVGCAAFLNFTIYAVFQPQAWSGMATTVAQIQPSAFVSIMVAFNAVILFAMGLAMISPYDHLKIWWRQRHGFESLLAEDSPPLPWLVVSATTAYILLLWGMIAWKHDVGFDIHALLTGLLQSITILIFVSRDILFLQWCRLTRMRAPLLKGFLYLSLYYIASAVIATVFTSARDYKKSNIVGALLTPAGAFDIGPQNRYLLWAVLIGLVIQVAVIIVLLMATMRKLSHSTATAPPSTPISQKATPLPIAT